MTEQSEAHPDNMNQRMQLQNCWKANKKSDFFVCYTYYVRYDQRDLATGSEYNASSLCSSFVGCYGRLLKTKVDRHGRAAG